MRHRLMNERTLRFRSQLGDKCHSCCQLLVHHSTGDLRQCPRHLWLCWYFAAPLFATCVHPWTSSSSLNTACRWPGPKHHAHFGQLPGPPFGSASEICNTWIMFNFPTQQGCLALLVCMTFKQGCSMTATITMNASQEKTADWNYRVVNKSEKKQMWETESIICLQSWWFLAVVILTHWYSFLCVIRINMSGLWSLCTLVSPSDRWITVETGAADVPSSLEGSCRLMGVSISWPGWSWTSYLQRKRTVWCKGQQQQPGES